MVSDRNCLKYFACFLYCNYQVHRDFLITVYNSTLSNDDWIYDLLGIHSEIHTVGTSSDVTRMLCNVFLKHVGDSENVLNTWTVNTLIFSEVDYFDDTMLTRCFVSKECWDGIASDLYQRGVCNDGRTPTDQNEVHPPFLFLSWTSCCVAPITK
jgi:hypothetical protein